MREDFISGVLVTGLLFLLADTWPVHAGGLVTWGLLMRDFRVNVLRLLQVF